MSIFHWAFLPASPGSQALGNPRSFTMCFIGIFWHERTVVGSGNGRVQVGDRGAAHWRGGDGGSSAAGAHAAFNADSLSRTLRSRPRIVRSATGSDGTGTYRERVLF